MTGFTCGSHPECQFRRLLWVEVVDWVCTSPTEGGRRPTGVGEAESLPSAGFSFQPPNAMSHKEEIMTMLADIIPPRPDRASYPDT